MIDVLFFAVGFMFVWLFAHALAAKLTKQTTDIVNAWKRKSASFHRREQRRESEACRLRRDLRGQILRAEWWRSEAKRLGWKPEQEIER